MRQAVLLSQCRAGGLEPSLCAQNASSHELLLKRTLASAKRLFSCVCVFTVRRTYAHAPTHSHILTHEKDRRPAARRHTSTDEHAPHVFTSQSCGEITLLSTHAMCTPFIITTSHSMRPPSVRGCCGASTSPSQPIAEEPPCSLSCLVSCAPAAPKYALAHMSTACLDSLSGVTQPNFSPFRLSPLACLLSTSGPTVCGGASEGCWLIPAACRAFQSRLRAIVSCFDDYRLWGCSAEKILTCPHFPFRS